MTGLEFLIGGTIAGIVALFTIAMQARATVKAAAERDALMARLNDIQTAEQIEQAVAGNDPATNRKELATWSER